MLSFGLSRTLRSIAAFVAALILANSAAVAATASDTEQALLDQIQETIARDGPNAAGLLDPLSALGMLYQENREHAFALVTLERAVHVVRVNRGLHTLDQVPFVLQIIRIEEARGNHSAAWDREQALLRLLRRHPDDVRTVPTLTQLADKQMALLGAVFSGKRPPQVVLGCYYKQWPTDDGNCHSGSRKTVEQGLLAEAQRTYSDAIGVLLRNGLYDSDELRNLELALLRGVDAVRSRYWRPADHPFALVPGFVGSAGLEPWRGRMAPVVALAEWDLPYPRQWLPAERESRHSVTKHLEMMDPYWRGRQSLLRLSAYAAAGGAPPLGRAAAITDVADWDLLYSRNGQALATYESVRSMLDEAAVGEAAIAQLFAPATPVVLPSFRENPFALDETKPAVGHVDVEFEITKYGRGREIEILGSANASPDATDRLVKLINTNRFRPRLVNGRFADATPVVMRYFLYD